MNRSDRVTNLKRAIEDYRRTVFYSPEAKPWAIIKRAEELMESIDDLD